MVCLLGVGALISTVAMHAVRVNHQFKICPHLVKNVNKLQCVLEVDVVVACAMS